MTQVSAIPAPATPVPIPDATTVATRLRERAVEIADHVHYRADLAAQRQGLTVSRCGLTGRSYRHPAFDTIGGAR